MLHDTTVAKTRKVILLLLAGATAVALSFGPQYNLVRMGNPADYYSNIPLIPLVSAFVLFKRRKTLSWGEPGLPLLGILVMAFGFGLVLVNRLWSPDLIARAELRAAGSILILSGTFLALFGKGAFRRALFPFRFLVFVIPLPIVWMRHIVSALVAGSTGTYRSFHFAFGLKSLAATSGSTLPITKRRISRPRADVNISKSSRPGCRRRIFGRVGQGSGQERAGHFPLPIAG